MANHDARHHRINEVLEEYWQKLRAGRNMPLESDVNINDIREFWDYCFLVNVHPDKFAYSHLGHKLIDAYGDDLTGKEVAETLLEPHPHSLYTKFKDVVAFGKPGDDASEFINSKGQTIKYRACILPLGAHGYEGVAYLLGGMKWKAF